jgi:uncharacterized protein
MSEDLVKEATKEWLIRLSVGLAFIVLILATITWVAGGGLADPVHRDIGHPSRELDVTNITFASSNGVLIHGWISHGEAGKGAIILLHGTHGDRRDMTSRAQFLHKQGFNLIMIDLQGHGETRGEVTTFGDRESHDVVAAIQYLHHMLPKEKVGVLAMSMGAAAFVLAEDRPPVDAVVLENLYPTIKQGIANRLRLTLGPFGPMFASLVLIQLQPQMNIPPARLRPIEHMSQIGAPLLIINGTNDEFTSIDDARALYAAASSPKELWAVEGAGHVDLHEFAKDEYERRVASFFAEHLSVSESHPDRPGT